MSELLVLEFTALVLSTLFFAMGFVMGLLKSNDVKRWLLKD